MYCGAGFCSKPCTRLPPFHAGGCWGAAWAKEQHGSPTNTHPQVWVLPFGEDARVHYVAIMVIVGIHSFAGAPPRTWLQAARLKFQVSWVLTDFSLLMEFARVHGRTHLLAAGRLLGSPGPAEITARP